MIKLKLHLYQKLVGGAFVLILMLALPANSESISSLSLVDGLGVNMHMGDPNPQNMGWYQSQMDQALAMGLNIVRFANDWAWDKDERDPEVPSDWTYNFDGQHWLVDQLELRGLRPLIILGFSHPLYETGNSITTPEGRQAFADFCASMVSEFKDKEIIWEMWNEANADSTWNANEYMAAITQAMSAMRQVDPNCIIIAPSTAGFDFTFLETCLNQGLLSYASAVSVHPYHSRSVGPEINFPSYEQMRNLVDTHSSGLGRVPIVNSELGYTQLIAPGNVITQDEQAALVIRSVLVDQMLDMPMHIIYNNRDYDGDFTWDQASFGLVTWDGQPKSAYYAVRHLTRLLDGLRYYRRLYTQSDDDYAIVFSSENKVIVVAWTASTSHTTEIFLPSKPIIMWDMKGGVISVPQSGYPEGNLGRKIILELTSEPTYIKCEDLSEFDKTIISHYKFDIDASDSTGLRNGTLVGGASITTSNKVGGLGALDLRGGSKSVDLPVATDLNGLSAFTISTWISLDAIDPIAEISAIFAADDKSINDGTVHMDYQTFRGTSELGGIFDGETLPGVTDIPQIPTGWFHIALTYDGTDIIQYVDGVPKNSGVPDDFDTLANLGSEYMIGGWDSFGSGVIQRYFDGLIDDIQIYSVALSDADIAFLFNNPGKEITRLDFIDFAVFASNWLRDDCDVPDWCSGQDINKSSIVDYDDVMLIASDWLEWQN